MSPDAARAPAPIRPGTMAPDVQPRRVSRKNAVARYRASISLTRDKEEKARYEIVRGNAKKSAYNREKRNAGYRGELLRSICAAVAPFVANAAYVTEFKIVTDLILDYRKTFEAQIAAQKEFQAAQQ